jgi:hypothetical protein
MLSVHAIPNKVDCILPALANYHLRDYNAYSKGLFTVVTKGRDQSFSCIVIGRKVGTNPSHFTLLRVTKVYNG